MSTTLGFKDILDKPDWRPLNLAPNVHVAGGSICSDLRNSEVRHPELFQLASAFLLNAYNAKNDGWYFVGSPALANSFGAGAAAIFVPHQGPRGTIGAGCSTSKIVTTTVWTIGPGMLANRGDSIGFRVRIIGSSAGGSGKIEERTVTANTGASGGAITFYLDAPLTFTPANGDKYEFLSGRVYLVNTGAPAANQIKYFDLITKTFVACSATNLPTLGTDTAICALDEQYVPHDQIPGDGFLGKLTSTGMGASSLTGHATAGDAAVLLNEYRNFQIRIIEDTSAPTTVGQRRLITSHTAGASPVYTLSSAWAVQPSTGAKYVIENCNYLLLVTGGTGNVYTYNPTPDTIVSNAGTSLLTDTWNASLFGARGANLAAGGCLVQAFGINPDAEKSVRHSHVYSARGGSLTIDLLDIAGGATGAWSLAIVTGFSGNGTIISTGSAWAYAPATQQGRFLYLILNVTNQLFRFDLLNRTVDAWANLRFAPSGTAVVGQRLDTTVYVDGATKITFLILINHTSQYVYDCLIQR
jgi:hypothetical protein